MTMALFTPRQCCTVTHGNRVELIELIDTKDKLTDRPDLAADSQMREKKNHRGKSCLSGLKLNPGLGMRYLSLLVIGS
jgi:hypothetical protein